MNCLVYPEASRRSGRLSRLSHRPRIALMAMFVAGYMALAALVGYYLSWGLVIMSSVIGVVSGRLDRRLRTIVTAESITVRGVVRTWTLPVSQVKEIVARDLVGRPVYLVTETGRRRKLHQVKPENLPAIGELTGLPIRDWTRTH